MFTIDYTPCGKPIYVTDMSEWAGGGYRDPITGRSVGEVWTDGIMKHLERKWIEDEVAYWVGMAPSGVFLRIYND